MLKLDRIGMQSQAGDQRKVLLGILTGFRGVKGIGKDRESDGCQVSPDLMRIASKRVSFDEGVLFALQ